LTNSKMKRLIKLTILIVFFLGVKSHGLAQVFSSKNSMIVYSECLKILENYQQLVNQIAESGLAGFEGSMSTSERLMELFINRKVLIYNDLDPQYQLSEYYELETYTSNMVLWYPDGIQISLDLKNARTNEIRKHEEGLYSTDIMLQKQIHGNYLNKEINANTEELIFRIAFTEQNNNFREFKIVGVRNSKSAGFLEDSRTLYQLKSIKLSENEREKVLNDIKQLLNDYQRSLIMLGDPNETEEDKVYYQKAFIHLFPDSLVKIYNDIEEKPEKTIISVEEYLNHYRAYYPEGIKNLALNIDSAEYGDVLPTDSGGFYSYVYADKFFSGKYQNRSIYRLSANLVFKIVFEKKDNLFTDFKIESIDRSGMAFLQGSGQPEEQAIPANKIQPITRKGFHMLAWANAGYSSIVNKNISAFTMEASYHEWKIDPLIAYSGGIGLEYFFGDHIGLSIGAGYGYFSTTYSLTGNFMEGTSEQPVVSYDINNAPFQKMIIAAIDSTVKISCLQFPVQVTGLSNKPQKTGLYCKAGINASVILDAKYDYNGKLSYWGDYSIDPDRAKPPYDSAYWPELGFYEKTDHKGEAGLKKFFISGTLSAGINIPLAYFTTLQIGPVFHFNITDIAEKAEYYDIFGNKFAHKPVSLNYLGLEISIRFL
jgi:hypothetical protein